MASRPKGDIWHEITTREEIRFIAGKVEINPHLALMEYFSF